eukprot:2048934-Pleurochrysis_carterae.AAC.1
MSGLLDGQIQAVHEDIQHKAMYPTYLTKAMRRTVSKPTPEELSNLDYDPEKDLARRQEEL